MKVEGFEGLFNTQEPDPIVTSPQIDRHTQAPYEFEKNDQPVWELLGALMRNLANMVKKPFSKE